MNVCFFLIKSWKVEDLILKILFQKIFFLVQISKKKKKYQFNIKKIDRIKTRANESIQFSERFVSNWLCSLLWLLIQNRNNRNIMKTLSLFFQNLSKLFLLFGLFFLHQFSLIILIDSMKFLSILNTIRAKPIEWWWWWGCDRKSERNLLFWEIEK